MSEFIAFLLGAAAVSLVMSFYLTNAKRQTPNAQRPTWEPIKRAEARAALCVGEDEPWWRAVHTAIAAERDSAYKELSEVDNQKHAPLMNYYAGHAQAMITLGEFLRSEREAGMKRVEAEE
jgi:hypothetical protein